MSLGVKKVPPESISFGRHIPRRSARSPKTLTTLMQTATPLTSTQNCASFHSQSIANAAYGSGLLNILKAVQPLKKDAPTNLNRFLT